MSDGQLRLVHVPATHIDKAWSDGARNLEEACETSGGEIVIDQLKMMLSRGERILMCGLEGNAIVGWIVFGLEQLPNVRVMHVYAIYAPHNTHQTLYEQLMTIARDHGCSELRCCAKPAQSRLYQSRFGFEPVYETLRKKL